MSGKSRNHIYAQTGRRACLACGAAWGAEVPCTKREAVTRAVAYRIDRERPVEWLQGAEHVNEAAGRPDGWG